MAAQQSQPRWVEDDARLDRVLRSLTAGYAATLGDQQQQKQDKQQQPDLLEGSGALEAARAVVAADGGGGDNGGGQTCLVCIEDIGRRDAIWSCPGCYCALHLPCILRWIRSGADSGAVWTCPNCRADFQASETPSKYTCYCGRVADPEFDPWLVPHSCGGRCDRPLPGGCGHACLLLCHPGRCPPCPRTLPVRCHCGACVRQLRCGQTWSCEQPCDRTLDCGGGGPTGPHRCPVPCHSGPCPPCSVSLVGLSCRCGAQTRAGGTPCAERDWCCRRVCGRDLGCGHHECAQVCHAGPCGACPAAQGRTCPCGKLPLPGLSCLDPVSTCSDTCGRPLACGLHACPDQCHLGPCPPCRETVRKTCRCGRTEREIQCHRQITCELKCNRDRGCGRHQCKRRCCPGGCPPCELPCGRPLNCGQHKCQSPCHGGPCYPCTRRVQAACPCGFAKVSRLCGSSRGGAPLRPPRCPRPCQATPDCGAHPAGSSPHACHPGPCPPCRLPCEAPLTCGHRCLEPCHAARTVTVRREVRGPWDGPQEVQEVRRLPCPPCRTPVPVRCLGGHETTQVACCEAKPRSCGLPCAQAMSCGLHQCELLCHELKPDDPRHRCERPCGRLLEVAATSSNPHPCRHPCPLACHAGPCPTCRLSATVRCHCGAVQLRRACRDLAAASPADLPSLLRCPNPCQRRRPACGHPCGSALCHSAVECAQAIAAAPCEAPVELRCPCRRIQRILPCHRRAAEASGAVPACDEVCRREADAAAARRRQRELASPMAAAEAAAAAAAKQAEADLLRRLNPQQRKRRRRAGEEADDALGAPVWRRAVAAVVARRRWIAACLVACLAVAALAWAAA